MGHLPEFHPRYNISPTQTAPVIVAGADGRRELRMMRWGLVPHWAKDTAIGNRLINARAETIATKPAFRDAYRHRRCLVPADGFYEWKKQGRGKQPYYIHRKDDQPFAFAGLWESWTCPDKQPLETFTIITTEPNDLLRPIHNRMPVVLFGDDMAEWVEGDVDTAAEHLRPCDAGGWRVDPVSTAVNKPGNEGAELIEPIDESPGKLF